MSDVFLLGAGFSRAISREMPLLGDLSRLVRERYNREIPSEVAALLDDNFELALSFLAQSKPWLPETDNLRHRALLLDFANVIAGVVGSSTRDAVAGMASESPGWLVQLIKYWHANKCTVLTLNYDTLLEVVSGDVKVGDSHLLPHHIYPPILMDAGLRGGELRIWDEIETYQLLKLHGSINWFYSGREQSFGESIYFQDPWTSPADFWVDRPVEPRRARTIADKFPFIIPPLFEKAPLFSHETVRSLWFQASKALEGASRLICIGYSLPASDLTMRQFIKSSIAKKNTPLVIVNRSNESAKHYQQTLALAEGQVSQPFSGEECVIEFVRSLSPPNIKDSAPTWES
jgi:hypothetical protein